MTKTKSGRSGVYRAPPGSAGGRMEKVGEVTLAGHATGGDTSAGRLAVRTYTALHEWEVARGDTLAAVLSRPPVTLPLPLTPQGEAVGYTREGGGVWITSERRGGPVHRLRRVPSPSPPVASRPEATAPPEAPAAGAPPAGVPLAGGAVAVAAALIAGAVLVRRRRRGREAAPATERGF